ncbi:MAG: sulfotransferase [Caldilineae bacterium]|nr:MAG: sulfotransferase [Caldilineae bacterium]
MKKIFVVGCARSGTTLVQKLFAAHNQVYTCKETHYFEHIRRSGKKGLLLPLDFLRLSPRKVRFAYRFIEANNELRGTYDPRTIRTIRDAAQFFDHLMTTEARLRGKSAWVEKTPPHLLHIPLIQRHIPAAQFVHVIRDGRDVVASLVDAGIKFPGSWWEQYKNIEHAIQFYNQRLQKSLQYCGQAAHIFVRYEDILADAEHIARCLYARTGLPETDFVLDLKKTHHLVVRQDEGWKQEHPDKIQNTHLVKFRRLFDETEQAQIERRVLKFPPQQENMLVQNNCLKNRKPSNP